MAITDTLADVWHAFEDRAWSLADFLEDKGVPLASFCEDKGVSPLLLFLGILIVIIIILAMVSGGAPGTGSAVLTVTVKDEAGNPIQTPIKIIHEGGTKSDETTINGVAKVPDLPHGSVTVRIDSSRYEGERTVNIKGDSASVEITAQAVKGTLNVVVADSEGGFISSGVLEVKDFPGGNVMGTENLDGSSSYSFQLPVGLYRAVVKSTSGGELDSKIQEIKDDIAYDIRFTLSSDSADSAAVKVVVKDENGNVIPGATVVLRNARSDAPIGTQQTTDSLGETTFYNIAIGTAVYPIVFVSNDRKYGQLDPETSRNVHRINVGSTLEVITVNLPLNGRVEVMVWDQETQAYISGASVKIMAKSGDILSETKQTDSAGKATFTGFEENLDVYPVVEREGYLDYENKEDAQSVSYRAEKITFRVAMERDGSFIRSVISLKVRDKFGDLLSGVSAVLSEAGGGFVSGLPPTDNVSFEVDANKNYNVALFKPGYLRKVVEGISASTHDAVLDPSNPGNSAHIEICTFQYINSEASPATSAVELFLATGALIDVGDTIGGDDGDNCITFTELPSSWSVSARATADGHPPVETDAHELIPIQEGLTRINITFNEAPPNAALTGDVKACVEGPNGNPVEGAEVLLHDFDMEGPTWDGQYRLTTASDGCVIFRNLPVEKTGYQGVLSPVRVYPIVSAPGYGTYNGKREGNAVAVQPQRLTPLNVRLDKGEGICIVVESDGSPLEGADVSLCANAQCRQVIETKKTEADGHVIFSSDVQSVTVRAVANIDGAVKEQIENFALQQVTKGSCGTIDLETVTEFATVTLDGIPGILVEAMPGESKEIEFILRVNDEPATGGAMSAGGQSRILADSGTEVLVEFTGDITGAVARTVSASEGRYAMPFIAPSQEGDYMMTLEASVPDCDSCQGDQRSLNLRVGDGDEDDDGVPDEFDQCPRTPFDAQVDANGCPVLSEEDSDGDGVPDDRDNCQGTAPGIQVDANGCPIPSIADMDNDGIPDGQDSFPNDPSRWYPEETLNQQGIPQQIANMPDYQQNSVRVCVVSDLGTPIYDASVMLYNTGGASPVPTTGYAPAGYGPVTPPNLYAPGYGQQWQLTHSSDNCRVFMGYTSMGSLTMGNFFSGFHLKVSKGGYEDYDSISADRSSITVSTGQGVVTVTVRLKRAGAQTMGGGSLENPARKVELQGPSWNPQDSDGRNSANLYPLVTSAESDVNLLMTYSIEGGAEQDLEYDIRYTINGNPCYEVGGVSSSVGGGRTLIVRRGQSTVTDEVTLYSKDQCWIANDPGLESEFTLTLDGTLVQIGSTEVSSASSQERLRVRQRFEPVRARIKPLVGATKQIRGISDLQELNDIMMLSGGVVTVGGLPYCIDEKGNTGRSKVVSTLRGVRDKTAAQSKIVIDFKGTNSDTPSDLGTLVDRIKNYITTRMKKSPLDCRVYVNTYDHYMGHIEVGQKGLVCQEAITRVDNRPVQPWEKVFCEAVQSGKTEGRTDLGGSYSMHLDSR